MPRPVWSNDIEAAAWMEKHCAHCYQEDEARKRVLGQGDGCPLLLRAAAGRLPTQWTHRRNAVMGDTYRCDDFLPKPPVNRRKKSTEQTDILFDVEPAPQHLVPVEGWPDYRAEMRKEGPEKL